MIVAHEAGLPAAAMGLVLFLALPSASFAAPTISGISRVDAHLVISGSLFGNKPTAAPIRYDDFEGAPSGDDVDTATSWYVSRDTDTNRAVVTDAAAYNRNNSHRALVAHLDTATNNPKFWKNSIGIGGAGSRLFVSFWVRWEWPTWDGGLQYEATQTKAWRVANVIESSGDVTYPAINAFNWMAKDYSYTWTTFNTTYYAGGSDMRSFPTNQLVHGQWHNYVLQVDQGSAGSSDGALYAWLSKEGEAYASVQNAGTGKMVIDATGGYINAIKFDNYLDANNATLISAGYNLTSVLVYDDIYLDNTWARVEISDNATYANCTHREVQVPSAWSSSEITVLENAGSFPHDASVYVFVVDADGNVSEGYGPFSLGAASDSTLPSPPGQLRILSSTPP